MKRSIQASASALILLGMTTTHARADLTFSLTDATIAPGDTATVDIYVMSPSPYTLSNFSVALQITTVGNPTSLLQFSPGVSQPTPPFGNPDYVFEGQSFDEQTMSPYFSDRYTTTYQYDSITGGDSEYTTQGGLGSVSIGTDGTTSSTFIGQVQFAAPAGATPGDEFQITVQTTSSVTEFNDSNDDRLTISSDPSTGGFVTVAATVPEPSSAAITLTGLGGLLLGWSVRQRVARRAGGTRPA